MAAVDPVFEQLQPAIAYMDAHLLENPPLARIARTVHLAPNYFHQRFTRTFFMTPLSYMMQRRLNLSQQLLLCTDLTLEQIASQTGFRSPFYLSRSFKKKFGLCPSAFRGRPRP